MPTTKTSPADIIAEAFAASAAAGRAQFERDGSQDCGTCGGYMLAVDGRSAVGKALLADRLGWKSSCGVQVRFPDGDCPSQHMEIRVQAGKAAVAVFERHGVKITEARSYVD